MNVLIIVQSFLKKFKIKTETICIFQKKKILNMFIGKCEKRNNGKMFQKYMMSIVIHFTDFNNFYSSARSKLPKYWLYFSIIQGGHSL